MERVLTLKYHYGHEQGLLYDAGDKMCIMSNYLN